MFVDLPPEFDRYRIGVGQYEGLAEWRIRDLVVSEYPYDPLFIEGSDEERFATLRRHQEEDRPEDYGVCDHPSQVAERWQLPHDDIRPLVVLFTEVRKADQPERGGWRWHKWGRYIGTRQPVCEYLADEPEIDSVHLFKILHVKG